MTPGPNTRQWTLSATKFLLIGAYPGGRELASLCVPIGGSSRASASSDITHCDTCASARRAYDAEFSYVFA